MVTLCIDNRERDRIALFQNYIKSGKIKIIDGIETSNYEVGDYFSKDLIVGIEYKKEDFYQSLYSGKLEQQLKELADNFQYPYLFIGYNSIIEMITNNLGTNPEVTIGELSSILARHKIPVIFVGDFLVPIVFGVIERFYDSKTPTKLASYFPIRNKPKKREPTLDEIKRHLILGVPRLGYKRGIKLLEHFNGSIKAIVNATEKDIMDIPGFGQKISKEIVEIFK